MPSRLLRIPLLCQTGATVFAGTTNKNSEFYMNVTATQENTKLGQILKKVEDNLAQKPKIVERADLLGRFFILFIFLYHLFI